MTTATVLLRSVVRLCAADAGVVDFDGDLCVFGVSAPVAAELLSLLQSNDALPRDRILVCRLPVPVAHPRRTAQMTIFGRSAKPIAPELAELLRLIADEIGEQLDFQAVAERERLSPAFVERLGHIAGGIDSINDAAAIFAWPRSGRVPEILYVNLAFEALFGYRADVAIGQTSEFLYGPLTDLDRIEAMNDAVRSTREARNTIVYYRRDGVPMWVELSLRGVPGGEDGAWCVVATLRDVTTRKEFEFAIAKEKRKLQVTLAAIGDGVITTVADGRVDFVNVAARTIFGIDAAEAYGEHVGGVLRLTDASGTIIDVLQPNGDSRTAAAHGQALFERGSLIKHIAYVTSPIAAEGYVIVLRDVTVQHRLATQLSYEASHDPLTSMYNRRKFDEILGDAIEAAQCGDGPHALAFLDLDRFKFINDTCGHAAGDQVLLDLAHRLQQQLRGRDVLARIGGDEFAVLLHECTLDNAARVIEKLQRAVDSYGLMYHGSEYGVGVSIGLAPIDGSEGDPAVIVARADAACYAAKHRGRDAIAG